MKIIRLKAENIKKLVAIDITPKDDVVKISGKNAAGKTAVMDCLLWGIAGADNIQAVPIRRGQEEGSIEIDLGETPLAIEAIVHRSFRRGKTTALTIENKDGLRFKTPQTFLESLQGKLWFDPTEFQRQEPRKQFETLRALTGVNFSKLDGARQRAYDDRTIINRDMKRLEAQLQGVVVPEEPKPAAGKEVDISRLAERVTAAGEKAREKETLQRQYEDCLKTGTRLEQDLVTTDDRLQEELREINEHIALLEKKAKEKKDAFDRWSANQRSSIAVAKKQLQIIADQAKAVDVPDIATLQAELKQAEEINREIRAAVSKYDNGAAARKRALEVKTQLDKELATAKKKSGDLDDAIDAIDAEKTAQIAKAEFPLDGLGFADDAVTFNGLPLEQASSAEQLRVSMAMAMALNPKLRVIRVMDGSLLDSDSLKIIEEMAKGNDFQVWMECVDESGKVGIYIEDGQVAAVNK